MGVYSRLAKQAADYLVRTNEPLPVPASLPPEFQRQLACYVTITETPGRHRRGLYGQPLPRFARLAEEIIANTTNALLSSAWRASRIDLPHLQYSVALLGPMERISDKTHLAPNHYGLYLLSDRGRSALLLPQRAGVETPDDQIATALREAGIETRRESATMYRFSVEYDDE